LTLAVTISGSASIAHAGIDPDASGSREVAPDVDASSNGQGTQRFSDGMHRGLVSDVAETDVTLESLLAAQPAQALDGLTLAVGGDEGPYSLRFDGYAQFRYTASVRQDPPADDGDLVHGFRVRRLKAIMRGHVGSPRVRYNVTFANRAGGRFIIERASIALSLTDRTTLDVGQFRLPLVLEETIGGRNQTAAERSRVAAVFGQGFSQGIQLTHTRERIRARAMFSDGIGSINTDFVNPGEADAALTGRLEARFGQRGWRDYSRFVAFRGSDPGAMLGLAGHWETAGGTGLGAPIDQNLYQVTADATVKRSGFSAHAAGHWRRIDRTGQAAVDDFGLMALVSGFVDERNELFARWDTVWPGGESGNGADPFSTLTAGVKHYFVPRSTALIAVLDAQYLFDDFTGSGPLIGTSTSRGQILDAEDGQVVVRLQFQVSF